MPGHSVWNSSWGARQFLFDESSSKFVSWPELVRFWNLINPNRRTSHHHVAKDRALETRVTVERAIGSVVGSVVKDPQGSSVLSASRVVDIFLWVDGRLNERCGQQPAKRGTWRHSIDARSGETPGTHRTPARPHGRQRRRGERAAELRAPSPLLVFEWGRCKCWGGTEVGCSTSNC